MSTVWDDHKNLAYSLVTVPPVPAGSGTSLTVFDSSSFPTAPFNALVWPPSVCAYLSNAEIVRVTLVAGNVLTIVRAQEGTSAQAIAVGWQIANTITAKDIDDIQDAVNTIESTAVFDGDAAGGVLAGTYPNPDLAASVAGDALSLTANVLDVQVDGVTVQVNGLNELEVISSGVLTDAVIIDPLTSVRNIINPAADVIPLSIFGSAGQTQHLLDVGVEPNIPFLRVFPDESVGLGQGTFVPSSYRGYLSKFVVSDQNTNDPDGGPYIDPGTQEVSQVIFDLGIDQTVDGAGFSGHYGLFGSVRMKGAKQAVHLTGNYYQAIMAGTAAPGTLSVDDVYAGYFYATTTPTSTGDVTLVAGSYGYAAVNGPNSVLGAITGMAGTAGDDWGTGSTIPKAQGLWGYVFSSGRVITDAIGLEVDSPGTPSFMTNVYGVLIRSQVGAATKSYSIFSEGGAGELRAGVATEIPLTLRGFAAQSANLFVTEDSAGADLVAITAAGKIVFGSAADTNLYRSSADVLTTDDSFLVGATLEQDGTSLGLLGAAPVVQQAATSLSTLWTALKNYGLLTGGSTAPAEPVSLGLIVALDARNVTF